MDKQQEAEKFANRYMNGRVDTKVFGDLVDGFEAGADWRDQQSPTDAVAFVEWIEESEWRRGLIPEAWHKKGSSIKYTTAELYKLFNPSGAAPQTAAEKEAYGNKAIDDIITTQKEWEEAFPKPGSPQAAGPVWVKASERLPNHYKSIYAKYEILHFGRPTLCSTILRYNVSSKKWLTQKGDDFLDYLNLIWLDDSGAPVFTREDMAKAYKEGGAVVVDMMNQVHPHTFEHYMDTHYPSQK